MDIRELFVQKKAVVSFEIFPPKPTSSINVIYETIDALAPLRPDYISVTYGAGGSTTKTTVDIASIITNTYHINALAHLTCYHSSQAQIDEILRDLEAKNVSNILALRGDQPQDTVKMEDKSGGIAQGKREKRDFQYASELAHYITKEYPGVCVAGACYPEGHYEAASLDQDIENLKKKVDAGVDFLITQLFFDNKAWYRFKEKLDQKGITVPIQAGIMPITNRKQIERITELTKANIPQKLIRILDKFEHNAEALKDAGIAYATEQIIELLANNIDGIHIYTMNKPQVTKYIVQNLESLIYAINKK